MFGERSRLFWTLFENGDFDNGFCQRVGPLGWESVVAHHRGRVKHEKYISTTVLEEASPVCVKSSNIHSVYFT